MEEGHLFREGAPPLPIESQQGRRGSKGLSRDRIISHPHICIYIICLIRWINYPLEITVRKLYPRVLNYPWQTNPQTARNFRLATGTICILQGHFWLT